MGWGWELRGKSADSSLGHSRLLSFKRLRIRRGRLTQYFDEGSGERRHLLSFLLIFPARISKPNIPDSLAKITRIPNPDYLLYMGQLKHTY